MTSMRERAIRKNSPQSMPERNRASAKKEARRYTMLTTTTPKKTVNAFAQ